MPQRFLHGTGLGVSQHREFKNSKTPVVLKDAVDGVFSQAGVARRPMIENLEARQLLSSTWFVAPYGSNSNAGTIAAPFLTIQQAANVAEPGDHVEIRAGVYHETVTPAHSGTPGNPITYEAYNGENVTVDEADPITGWTQYSGSIYSAPMSVNLGEGSNEVFVNGSAINEAMFPNSAIGDFSHPNTLSMTSVSVSGNTAVIHNSSLGQAANTWKGAIVHMSPGQGWDDQTGTVTSSSPGSITVSFTNHGANYSPVAGNSFYLFGKFAALDTAGEWYRDPTSGRLYAWMPNSGNPASEDVEVKVRTMAFNLGKVHDITIHGIHVFAGTISTVRGVSNDVVINGVTSLYGAQLIAIPDGSWVNTNQGAITIMGNNSTVENSTIGYTSGQGIVVGGTNNLVENNVVHDTVYTGANAGAIYVTASNVKVDHNTVYNSGRDGILTPVAHATITYNTIHDVGLQTTEPGGIYTVNVNGEGSVMAYNTIYNIHTGGYGGTALFADNNSSGWSIHNNVTYNVDYAFKMNYTSNNDQIYNNTLGATKKSINTNDVGNWDGVKIYNNIFEAPVVTTPGASVYNNATSLASANSSQGAGSFSSGASGAAVVTTPPVTTPPVTTPPVTTPPVTTPPAITPPSTTPLATSKIMAVNDTAVNNLKGDNFGGLGYAYDGSWASYTLDFGTAGAATFTAGVATINAKGSIQIRIGSPTGTLLGTLNVAVTGAWNNYTAQSTTVTKVTGVQKVYLVFKGPVAGVCNLDWLQFSSASTVNSAPPPVTSTAPLATSKITATNYTGHLNVMGDGFGGVGDIYTGDWVSYTLNFGTTGVTKFTGGIAAKMAGTVQIRLGSPTGTLVGTLKFSATGAWNNYTAQSTAVSKITGVQTVYLVFSGWQWGVANIDWLQFS